MKIVQAFNQQGREAQRFTSATEAVFSTARKRIAQGVDDLPDHLAGLLIDHLGHLAGRGRCKRGPDDRRHDRRLRPLRRLAGGRVRRSAKFMAICCAPPVLRND